MPLFGAASAAPNKGTTISYRFRSLSTVLSPAENRRNQDFSRPLSYFPVLFKAYLIFNDFIRKPSKFKYFSSLCEPWSTVNKACIEGGVGYPYLISLEVNSQVFHIPLSKLANVPIINFLKYPISMKENKNIDHSILQPWK